MEKQFSGKSFRNLWTTSRGSPLFPFGMEFGKYPYHLRESFRFQGPVSQKSRNFTGRFRVSQFPLYLKNGEDLIRQTSQLFFFLLP